MTNRIGFTYGNFYDVPRHIQFQFQGKWYFLHSRFDEDKDDYADVYDVYLLPFRSKEEIEANPNYWLDLSNTIHLGSIPIDDLALDQTRRESIDAIVFDKWLSAHKQREEA